MKVEREKRRVEMDKNNPTEGSGQGNNFFGGFLLGLLVGGALVFLLGTKKGKKLLKTISEEGQDNISNLLKKVEETEDLDETMGEPKKEFVQKREFVVREKSIEKPKVRRFFRGISRHVN